jgi:hypothetical protein
MDDPSSLVHTTSKWLSNTIYSLSEPQYGGLAALLPGMHHTPDNSEDSQPQLYFIVFVLQAILIDTHHRDYYSATSPSLSPSSEQFDLRELLDLDLHAPDTDTSH